MKDAAATGEIQYIAPVRIAFLELAATRGPKSLAQEHFQKILEQPMSSLNQWFWAEFWFWAVRSGLEVSGDYVAMLPEPYKLLADRKTTKAATRFDELGMS